MAIKLQTNAGVFKYEIIKTEGKPTLKVFSNNSDNALHLEFIKNEGWVLVRPTQVPGTISMYPCCEIDKRVFFRTDYNSPLDAISIDHGAFNFAINKSYILKLEDSNKLGFGSDDFHVICTFTEDECLADFEVNAGVYQ